MNRRPVPNPKDFDSTLRFRETKYWYVCGPEVIKKQGWKIYISANPNNFADILASVKNLLVECNLHFKYIRTINSLRKLNTGNFGYSQIGKSIVLYLPKPKDDMVQQLMGILNEYRDECPVVPFAESFGNDLPLYYRYGAYKGFTIELDNLKKGDDRTDYDVAIPKGIKDPFAAIRLDEINRSDFNKFLLYYPSFESITQQGKCGIFGAMDMRSKSFREVILKVGYPNGQVQADGRDGSDFIRRELYFYNAMSQRGITYLAPELVDSYDEGRDVALVLERLNGKSLLQHLLNGSLLSAHLEACWDIITQIHENGLYLGDAKLANFLLNEDDKKVFVIDFETSGVIEAGDTVPIRTFDIQLPIDKDVRLFDCMHFLASVLFDYSTGQYEIEDRRINLTTLCEKDPESSTQRWAITRLREVLSANDLVFAQKGTHIDKQKRPSK
ncbi:MAG: hypothetical protein NUV44_07250 [Candidatus Scalindua sp.]|nr:hypothetical protein [Candidatus Scalindua sp.]